MRPAKAAEAPRAPARRRRGALVALVGALLAASLFAAGAAGARPPGPQPGRLVERHAERLELDAEQRAALREALAEAREEGRALFEDIRAVHARIRSLLAAPEVERDALFAEAERLGALRTEAHKERLRSILRIHAILSPEQRAELLELRRERHGERGERGGRGRGRPGRDGEGACAEERRRLCEEAGGPAEALGCLGACWEALSDGCRRALGRAGAAPDAR